MKTIRNVTLAAVLSAIGIGAAFAHGQHGQHGQQGGCHGGERHEQQKDGKHEHDTR